MPSSQKVGKIKKKVKMKRVMRFSSSRKHYVAGAFIVWCVDHRFRRLMHKFAKTRGFKHFDRQTPAGGAKALAGEKKGIEYQFITGEIRKLLPIHKFPRVILMTHTDCAAYGGFSTFGTKEREHKVHVRDLARAANAVKKEFPGITVEKFFADFEGLHKVV